MKKYYEVHVRHNAQTGYTAFFEAGELTTQADITQHAVMLGEILPEEAVYVDYALEITKGAYDEAMNERLACIP